jgi:hypothetical protein
VVNHCAARIVRKIMRGRLTPRLLIAALLIAGCARATSEQPTETTPPAAIPAPVPEQPVEVPPPPPAAATHEAREALFPAGIPDGLGCEPADDEVRCLIEALYADDTRTLQLALTLYDEFGDVAGVEPEYEMDGGWRGQVHVVPQRPVGAHRQHLQWALDAQRDIERFEQGLRPHAGEDFRYRHTGLCWRFFDTPGKRTPSAMALDWLLAYNVSGSLNKSPDAVRELIVHEVFHFHDQAANGWSRRALGTTVDEIVARCGTDIECLRPYAPNRTKVVGGTWYAFQPDNGDIAHEYAAELALRYFREQREILEGRAPLQPAFKCGPEENAQAWQALADEFFGGVDLVPGCGA